MTLFSTDETAPQWDFKRDSTMVFSSCSYRVDEEEASKRIDVYLAHKNPSLTRSRIKNLIESGDILLNNNPAKAGTRLKAGDVVLVDIPAPEVIATTAEPIPLDIIYEDEDLIVVNKAPGMVVHAGAGHKSGTLVNAILYHARGLSGIGGVLRPGIVHRLDKNTSGVMVVAKNDECHLGLARQFKEHSIKRRYMAVAWGVPSDSEGTIDMSIGRHPVHRKKMSVNTTRARRAVTRYKILRSYGKFSLLELSLETGRTHQIRVHLSHIHHPVVGDPVYGKRSIPSMLPKPVIDKLKSFRRQALHAGILGFVHPLRGGYMEFASQPPEDMKSLIEILEEYCH